MKWKTVKLGEVANVQTGPFGSQLHNEDYVIKGTPIVTVEHLGARVFSTQNLPCVSDADKERLKKYTLKEGDVVFSRVGSVDRCSYVSSNEEGWLFSGRCLRVRTNEEVYPLFLYYYLQKEDVKQSIRNIAVGATMPSINTKLLSEIEVAYPSHKEQLSIAAILSSLDDKIENNNRINANLEAQAQALFKSWFIDFEPFGGVIPENWIFDNISAFPHILETGRRPKGGAVESGLPSIGAEHIKGMGTYDYSKTKYITEEYARSMRTGKINGYELLIYKDGGKPGYFIPNFTIYGEGYPFEECYINEHVLKLDFPDKAFNIFCYFYFQEPEVMTYLNAQGGKAAIPGINKSDIENINVLSPGNEVIKQFGDIVMPYFTTILRNLKENQRLAALRDTLLPKLMKGEIAL